MTPQDFLPKAIAAAKAGGHIFPDWAACEAAVESGWGQSQLAREANNLFGQKAPHFPPPGWSYPSIHLPTHEWEHGELVEVSNVAWPAFPDWATSFRERMELLRRLSMQYSDYMMALHAPDGETFVRRVSATWSDDPHRADKVVEIHAAHRDLLHSLLEVHA